MANQHLPLLESGALAAAVVLTASLAAEAATMLAVWEASPELEPTPEADPGSEVAPAPSTTAAAAPPPRQHPWCRVTGRRAADGGSGGRRTARAAGATAVETGGGWRSTLPGRRCSWI